MRPLTVAITPASSTATVALASVGTWVVGVGWPASWAGVGLGWPAWLSSAASVVPVHAGVARDLPDVKVNYYRVISA